MPLVTSLSPGNRTPFARHRTRAALLTVTVAAVTTALFTPAAYAHANAAVTASAKTPAAVTDPAALVDPFVGTGSGGAVVGQVDTFPGADMPFGMIQWSPDTPSRPDGGGYNYADTSITGFSLTHFSGPGCQIAG